MTAIAKVSLLGIRIFLQFYNIFQVPKILSLSRLAAPEPIRMQFFYIKYHVAVYLWWLKHVLKWHEVQKQIPQDCLVFFILLFTSLILIQFFKIRFCSENIVLLKELSQTKVTSLLMTLLGIKQVCHKFPVEICHQPSGKRNSFQSDLRSSFKITPSIKRYKSQWHRSKNKINN